MVQEAACPLQHCCVAQSRLASQQSIYRLDTSLRGLGKVLNCCSISCVDNQQALAEKVPV